MSLKVNHENIFAGLDVAKGMQSKAFISYSKALSDLIIRWTERLGNGEELYVAEVKCKPTIKYNGNDLTMAISTELEPLFLPKGADMEYITRAMSGKEYYLYGPFTKELVAKYRRMDGCIYHDLS